MTSALRDAGSPLDASSLIRSIQDLRSDSPHEAAFWARYAQALKHLCRADGVWIACPPPAVAAGAGNAQAQSGWQVLASVGTELPAVWLAQFADMFDRVQANGFATSPASNAAGAPCFQVCVQLPLQPGTLLLLEIAERERPMLKELVLRAQLVADAPGQPGARADTGAGAAARPASAPQPLKPEAARLLPLLDLAAQVMQESAFRSAALCLVNGLVARLGAAQVAFGWVRRSQVHVAAISHIDRFERHANDVQLLEAAMEEALESEHGVAYDGAVGGTDVPAGHRKLAGESGFGRIRCVVLRRPSTAPAAVLLLGYSDGAGAPEDGEQLEAALELILPWLQVLHERDQWWGRRLHGWLGVRLERALGPGHGWARAAGLAASLFVLYALFGTWHYRVDATGQLATDSTRVISAQFDGRVESAMVSSGDLVRQGAMLSSLDTRELQQQASDLRADIKRFATEADKARAAGALAEVEIASARGLQAEAKLARVSFLMGQSVGVAPFDGVIVEGERKDLQGAPVRRGDRLFKIARIEGLYAVLQVPERDIRYIAPDASGELVLVTRPDERIPFKITSVIPVAQTKGQEGNHFMIKAELAMAPQPWWRPGMSGTVRIDAGQHNVAWILTHRIVDTVRMKLWL